MNKTTRDSDYTKLLYHILSVVIKHIFDNSNKKLIWAQNLQTNFTQKTQNELIFLSSSSQKRKFFKAPGRRSLLYDHVRA